MDMKGFSERLGVLISSNQLDQALKEMRQLLNSSPKLKEVIIQSARYNELKEQIRMGTISYDNEQTTKANIMLALLELTNEIKEQTLEDETLSLEVQDTISQILQPSNTINQTHSGTGDNIGGNKIINY